MAVNDIARLRREYARESLDQSQVAADPIEQFRRWFDEALQSELPEPNAMVLATVSASGRPAARTVLLKGHDQRGLVFFTNYESRKGRDLAQNPQASLLFVWLELERQVRAEGSIERVSTDESDAYFVSRPADSRLGAWASPQSRVVANRQTIEGWFDEAKRLHGDDPRRPPHWGGYRLLPDLFEFWQGRPNRLHDRIQYRYDGGRWVIERLAP